MPHSHVLLMPCPAYHPSALLAVSVLHSAQAGTGEVVIIIITGHSQGPGSGPGAPTSMWEGPWGIVRSTQRVVCRKRRLLPTLGELALRRHTHRALHAVPHGPPARLDICVGGARARRPACRWGGLARAVAVGPSAHQHEALLLQLLVHTHVHTQGLLGLLGNLPQGRQVVWQGLVEAHEDLAALPEHPVHTSIRLPAVQPEPHREAGRPLKVVNQGPVVEAPHVIALCQGAQHLLEVGVDHDGAPVIPAVSNTGLGDVHGHSVLGGPHDGLVHSLWVYGVVHVSHDLPHHAAAAQPPAQNHTAVEVDAPPVTRRLALGVLPLDPRAQHRQPPLKLPGLHEVVHHVPPPPVLHPVSHILCQGVQQAVALCHECDVVVHEADGGG
mmetsp:Transcript_6320/g.13947  ORF Transcript_6320/g.13947 Transcript_6320/m.13947 type:complete len:384 (+) Transcript_6320:1008-2159(+)